MSDKIFASGIFWDEPAKNAPDFVVGKLSIKVVEAIDFLTRYKKQNGYVNLDVKKSQGGKVYIELNTWTPVELKKVEQEVKPPRDVSKLEGTDTLQENEMPNFDVKGETFADSEINPDDIPF